MISVAMFSHRLISGFPCRNFCVSVRHMKLALRHAQAAYREKEIPVGAVIVDNDGTVVAATRGKVRSSQDNSAHAEVECVKAALNVLGKRSLNGYTLYTTLEPCAIVMGAVDRACLSKVIFGAYDSNVGASKLVTQNSVEVVGGVLEEESSDLLTGFFSSRNDKSSMQIYSGRGGSYINLLT